jgi:hypothetical protein
MHLIGAEDIFAMQDGEAESLVGRQLGCELIGGDGQGEMVDAEEAGERGEHCRYGRAKHWGLGRRVAYRDPRHPVELVDFATGVSMAAGLQWLPIEVDYHANSIQF